MILSDEYLKRGTNQNPYIDHWWNYTILNQSNGIYLGYDSGDTKLSLKGGAVSDGFLTWDGSNLNIQGSINITGGVIVILYLLNSETSSLETGVNNSVLSGSHD